MAGIPDGYRRVNFNASEELYRDLALAQDLLGRTQASLIRQALLEFFARQVPAGALGHNEIPAVVNLIHPFELGKAQATARVTPALSAFDTEIEKPAQPVHQFHGDAPENAREEVEPVSSRLL